MPAGIITALGDHMMSVKEVPWHGLGTILPDLATAKEALEAAKLNWKVKKEQVVTQGGVRFEGKFLTVREDTGHPLGVVGRSYEVLQNEEAFRFFDKVTQDPNGPKYVTAGSLWGGSRIWALAKLPSFIEVVKDDIVEEYLLLTNTHDASARAEMFYTAVRVVCQNTLSMAMGARKKGEENTFKWRHIGSIDNYVEDAQNILGIAKQNHTILQQVTERLINFHPTEDQITDTLSSLFGSYRPGKETAQSERVQSTIRQLAESGKGQDLPGVAGSAWGLYNGITEYLDYHQEQRSRVYDKEESRLHSIWFGSAKSTKELAMSKLLELSKS